MKLRIVAAPLFMLLNGCGASHMALPADVAQASEELPITDRSSWSGALVDESFNLGKYKVADVDRKWNSSRSSNLFGNKLKNTNGGYSYKLLDQGVSLEGNCATEDRQRSQSFGGGFSFNQMIAKLGCSCKDVSRSAYLVLDATSSDRYEGVLSTVDGNFHVASISEHEGGMMSSDPTGYRLDADDGAKGAVEVLSTGRVWMSKTLEGRQRAEVACVFAGLLLYQPPKER